MLEKLNILFSGVKSFLGKIQRSDNTTKRKWLVLFSFFSILFIFSLWAIYFNFSILGSDRKAREERGEFPEIYVEESGDGFFQIMGRGTRMVSVGIYNYFVEARTCFLNFLKQLRVYSKKEKEIFIRKE